MEAPNIHHIFGTDLLGNDILLQCSIALIVELITVSSILFLVHFGGFLAGSICSFLEKKNVNIFLQVFLRFWASMPVLLIATFLIVIFNPGQFNVIIVLSFFLVPSQTLFVLNQFNEVTKSDFITAKKSHGFSNFYIYRKHFMPYISKNYLNFTISRIPEIMMLDFALNFFGLGMQPPLASFGRMLFDGLGFMFSAWWLWVFPSLIIIVLNILLKKIYESQSRST